MTLPSSLRKSNPLLIGIILALLLGVTFLLLRGAGFDFFRASLLDEEGACSDQRDNDGDGKIDYPADLGCIKSTDRNERQDGECFDEKDNDGDGAADAADFSCRILFNGESMPKSRCQDGVDNDKDGKIDMTDGGCANAQDHSENG